MLKHSACSKGKRVLVILRSGERIEDRFLDRRHGWLVLKQAGRIKLEDVRSFTILRDRVPTVKGAGS